MFKEGFKLKSVFDYNHLLSLELRVGEDDLPVAETPLGPGLKQPITSQYSGHVICLDQSEASIQVT